MVFKGLKHLKKALHRVAIIHYPRFEEWVSYLGVQEVFMRKFCLLFYNCKILQILSKFAIWRFSRFILVPQFSYQMPQNWEILINSHEPVREIFKFPFLLPSSKKAIQIKSFFPSRARFLQREGFSCQVPKPSFKKIVFVDFNSEK